MVFKRKLPDEVVEFIMENVKSENVKFIKESISNKFNITVSDGAIAYYKTRYVENKHIRRGKYKPSFLTKPIGTERVDKDGYIRVIVEEGKERLKHHLVWEKENKPVEKDEILMFLDGDKKNCDVSNLILVKRKWIGAINNILKGVESVSPVMRKTAILTAQLMVEANEKKDSKKNAYRHPRTDYCSEVLFLHKQGFSINGIAKKLNKSTGVISWILRRWRLGYYD